MDQKTKQTFEEAREEIRLVNSNLIKFVRAYSEDFKNMTGTMNLFNIVQLILLVVILWRVW